MKWRELHQRMSALGEQIGLKGMIAPYADPDAHKAEELLHELAHAILLGVERGPHASDDVSDAISHMRTRYADEHEARTCALEIAISRKLARPIGVATLSKYASVGMQGHYLTTAAVKRGIEAYLKNPSIDVLANRGVKIIMAQPVRL